MSWRSPITLLVLVVILVGGFYFGYKSFTSSNPSSTGTTTSGSCINWKTIPAGTRVIAKSITINVYNAGTVSGEAAKVLTALHNRGFREGVAANPPAGIEADNVTIRTERPRSPIITLVKEQFNGTVVVSAGAALNKGIDIIIGSGYAGIDTKAPTQTIVDSPIRVCIRRSAQ